MTPRRTFARVQPTTKQRVDLGLRLEGQQAGGRLQPSKIHETMPLKLYMYMDHHEPRAMTLGLRPRQVDVITAYEDQTHEIPDTASPQAAS